MTALPLSTTTPAAIGALQACRVPLTRVGTQTAIVALFGGPPSAGMPKSWSLLPFQKPGDSVENPKKASAIDSVCRQLSRLRDTGTHTWYAPDPREFNGKIVSADDLQVRIPLGRTQIYRGACAEGVVLTPGTGLLLSTAGCPLVLASDGRKVIAAHAGLRSLVRWNPSENMYHRSVIAQIAASFGHSASVRAWIFFSIRPNDYEHSLSDPRYAKESERILSHLVRQGYQAAIVKKEHIDLPTLIRLQLREYGIQAEQKGACTYQHSSAYHTRLAAPENTYRNLVAVTV